MTDKEEAVNKILDKEIDRYLSANTTMQNNVLESMESARHKLMDLLNEYADKDGRVAKTRINALLRKLGEIEGFMRDELEKSIEEAIEETTNKAINAAILALGTLAIISVASRKRIEKQVRTSFLARNPKDGMTVKERIWRTAGGSIDNVRNSLRNSVLRGDSILLMGRNVKKVFDKDSWMVRRLVITEGTDAYREAIAGLAIESKVVKAVQIVDNRGRHVNHKSHECYRLAEQNMYGWGKGMYRPQDEFIYEPHPQCTAYFRFILTDEIKSGGES